jgi:chromosomal replication initiation ATPase DnaA
VYKTLAAPNQPNEELSQMDRLAVEDNEFPPPQQPLTQFYNPQELNVLLDALLAPWSKRTALDLQRAARRERKAKKRAELQVRLQIVIARVEKLFRLPLGALSSERRTSRIAMARHIAYYLCHMAGGSFPVIGQHLGRDHSSVHHGFWLIRGRMNRDAGFRLFIEKLASQVTGAAGAMEVAA